MTRSGCAVDSTVEVKKKGYASTADSSTQLAEKRSAYEVCAGHAFHYLRDLYT